MAEEGALLALGPLDGLLAELDLKIDRVGDARHEIDQRAHCVQSKSARVSERDKRERDPPNNKPHVHASLNNNYNAAQAHTHTQGNVYIPILAVLALAMASKKGRICVSSERKLSASLLRRKTAVGDTAVCRKEREREREQREGRAPQLGIDLTQLVDGLLLHTVHLFSLCLAFKMKNHKGHFS